MKQVMLTGAAIGKPRGGMWYWGSCYGNGALGATRREICMKAGNANVDFYSGIGAFGGVN
ncbi:MAG: hypothetical protein Q4G70_13710 [Pseudomonadota bacterium]|nr:hypothetical protein [Pseudomonadota bacterium]